MRANRAILVLCLSFLVGGCTAQVFEPTGGVPGQPSPALGLKGSWNFWMRLETSISNSLVKGTMVVQHEECGPAVCQLDGLILKPQLATIGTKLNFKGVAIPSQNLIRIEFNDLNNRNDPIFVIVEFDLFLQDFEPARTMVGHFVMFNQSAPGPLNEDSSILVEADRGQLTSAGRVTAWPIVISDPTLPK